jgi:methionyl-tRNA formyltransferase
VGGDPGQIVSAGPGREWGVTCGDGSVFVPESLRVDEGVRAEPTSLAMFRPGRYFDVPSEHMMAATRRTPLPGSELPFLGAQYRGDHDSDHRVGQDEPRGLNHR